MTQNKVDKLASCQILSNSNPSCHYQTKSWNSYKIKKKKDIYLMFLCYQRMPEKAIINGYLSYTWIHISHFSHSTV